MLRRGFMLRYNRPASSRRPRRERYLKRRRRSTLQRSVPLSESSIAKADSSSEGGLRRGLLYFGREY